MSEENVESMHRSVSAFTRGDRAAWLEFCDPQIEAVPVGDWPEAEIRGRDAVWDFLVAADEPWEPGPYTLTEVVDGDDHVVARMRKDLRGKSSGVEIEYDYWVAFTFDSGKATRVEWFATRDEALQAAGLREQVMSEENVAVFRKGYAAVNRGDIDGFLATVHPDVKFTSLIAEAEGETFRGHDGVRRWWTEVVLPLGGLHGEPEEVRDLGDIVIARIVGTYRPRGVEVRQRIWQVTRYRDGKAKWWQFFRTEKEALEAAGSSE